jgi:hypothetical protein
MGLQLVEGEFDLPALHVGRGQVGGRCLVGVDDGGEQSERIGLAATVIDAELDHPDRQRLSGPSGVAAGTELGEP